MKNRNVFFYFTLSHFLVFFSGIIRHDVDEKEYLDLAKSKQFDAAGQVIIDNSHLGTCVLIHKKYVLSAAHVFMRKGDMASSKSTNGLNENSSLKEHLN